MRHTIIFLFFMLFFNSTLKAGDIYVSNAKGNDSNDGSKASPIETLEMALKKAREWRRLKSPEAEGGINIILEGGTYQLTKPIFFRPEDSGTKSSPTVIRALESEEVIISGGKKITSWQKGVNDERVPLRLRDSIWVTTQAPMIGNHILETRQLWVNNHKALRATQFGFDKMERMKDFSPKDQSITIPTPNQDLKKASQLEMLVNQRWATAILRVKEMEDLGDGYTKVKFHEPESSIEFSHPWPQPVIDGEKGSSAFCLENALELLDTPGEWYQDYPSGLIYYYPKEGEDMMSAEVIAPVLETLLEISGTRERGVENISFYGLSFEHSAWRHPLTHGNVTLQGGFRFIDGYKLETPGLFHKAELENQAWIERPEAALKLEFAKDINFNDCKFSHLGATGVDLQYAVSSSSINDCNFQDIGGTAILIGWFSENGFETHIPYVPSIKDDLCHDIKICGNNITNAANEDWGCVGIGAGYVRGIEIDKNIVKDVSYSGICVGWGWTALESGMRDNRITGNTISNYAKRLYDAGGIYTLSNQPGSVISGNKISLPEKAPYATNDRAFTIYFDEATDSYKVEDNDCQKGTFGYNKPGPNMVIKEKE